MADLTDKVVNAKIALMTALGDNAQKYMNHMKFWFRYKWSKEEFDFEARKLLTNETMHLHNQFLLAILNKVDAFYSPKSISAEESAGKSCTSGSSNRKRKRSSKASYFERVAFEPYDFLDIIGEETLKFIPPPTEMEKNPHLYPAQRYAVQELLLPDAGFILGRLMIGTWEQGMASVDDNVAEYIALGVRILLKNLLSAIIMKQKHYKVTSGGSFYYDIGCPVKDIRVRNTVTRQKIDDGPLELDKEITSPNFMRRSNEEAICLAACEELYPCKKRLITLRDCQRALTDRNLIGSHAVYSVNMERLTQMLH